MTCPLAVDGCCADVIARDGVVADAVQVIHEGRQRLEQWPEYKEFAESRSRADATVCEQKARDEYRDQRR